MYRERGSTTLFIAGGVLPLMIFLLSLGLNFSRYYSTSEQWQTALDEAASYSHRFLPYRQDAQAAVKAYLNRFGPESSKVNIAIDQDSVALMLNAPIKLSFAAYFGIEAEIPLAVYSKARGVPFDTYILLDTSSYVSPGVQTNSAWGDALEWPASTFFEFDQPLSSGTTPLNPRVVTQQCFNPTFSALKNAAIQAYEYVAAFSANAVGVGVYPGTGNYVDRLREVTHQTNRSIGPGEVDFNSYIGTTNRNVLCAAAAERENYSEHYRFPLTNAAIESGSVSTPTLMILPAASPYDYTLNLEYLAYLRTREVLWAQAARGGQTSNFAEVLREIRAQLMGVVSSQTRGGLVNSAIKSAMIFAGDVPWVATDRFPDGSSSSLIQSQLDLIKTDLVSLPDEASFKLTYVVFMHEGNSSPDFVGRVESWRNFLSSQQLINGQISKRFQLELVYLDQAASLSQVGIGNLLLSRRSSVLSR